MFELFSSAQTNITIALAVFFTAMVIGTAFNYATQSKYSKYVDRTMAVVLLLLIAVCPVAGLLLTTVMFLIVYNAADYSMLICDSTLNWKEHHKRVLKKAVKSFAGF